MAKRHRDAQLIDMGACNPGAIARAIVAACDECRIENLDTQGTLDDPAIRLMVHQLAFLTRANLDCAEYEVITSAVKAQTAAQSTQSV